MTFVNQNKYLWYVLEQVIQPACLASPLVVFFLFSALVVCCYGFAAASPACGHTHSRWQGRTKVLPSTGRIRLLGHGFTDTDSDTDCFMFLKPF